MHTRLTPDIPTRQRGQVPIDSPPDRELASRLGRYLAQMRAASGLTQEQVAHSAGINRNHYQLLESGLSDRKKNTPANPRLSTLVALADTFGTSVPEIIVDLFPEDRRVAVEVDVDHPAL